MASEQDQPRRLMLTTEEFGIIVRGGVVQRDGVAVALADIGFLAMVKALRDASSRPREPMPWDVDPEGWEEVMQSARKAIEGGF